MIISYYHGFMSIDHIRELLKINQNGTTAYHLVEGAKKIGFEAKGVKCNLEEINADNIVLPCIANVIINKTYRHFVVIYKIDFTNNTLLIADPSNKIMKMSFDIFKSIFSGVIIMLYPNDEIPCEKHKNLKLNFIIRITKSHPKLIKQIIVLSIFITIFSIGSSFFLGTLSDNITRNNNNGFVLLIIFVFITTTLLKILSDFFRRKILLLINEKINLEYTLDTFNRVLLLPYNSYRQKTTGDLVTRILDVSTIKENISKIFLTLIIDLPLALISIVLLFIINDKLCLISCIILILYIIIFLLFKDYFDQEINDIKKNNVITTNYVIELVNNFETVKGLDIYDSVYQQFEKKFVMLLKRVFQFDNAIAVQKLFKDIISECGLLLIYGIGAFCVVRGQLSFGSLLSFGALLTYFFEPVKNIVNLETNFRELDLVLRRINDLNTNLNNNGICDESYCGTIRFTKLNFGFDNCFNVLNDINLDIKYGNKVLVLGPSGSGKSTLFKLLMKYYNVERGKIYINEIDINDYNKALGIRYISQDERLFTDSLYQNIVLYDKVNINKMMEIINICHIDEIIKNNPLGYNMLIEENGFNLSGGERQRIILARTLLKHFNVLIIDEGLSQVDINMERVILKDIFTKFKNKTIIVISHRMDNSDLYDQKIVLNYGALVENVSKVLFN